jgi:hypothetical protein
MGVTAGFRGGQSRFEDEAEIVAFFARCQRAHGHGDAHPDDRDYRCILIRVTPTAYERKGSGLTPVRSSCAPPPGNL